MQPKGSLETILVVDDDVQIRTLVGVVLEHAGYSVIVAADGLEALSLYRQNQSKIGLLLTDVMMPKMDGLDLANRLLQLDSQLKVLFMSGDASSVRRGSRYIVKPFRSVELVGTVAKCLVRQASSAGM